MEYTAVNAVAILWLVVTQIAGAMASDSDIIGTAVAGGASFIMLCIVIAIIAMSFSWTKWYNNWMRDKGKVRMPKHYFQKKKEAQKKLLSSATSAGTNSVVNGQLPAQNTDTGGQNGKVSHYQHQVGPQTQVLRVEEKPRPPHQAAPAVQPVHLVRPENTTSWVHGWNQRTANFENRVYEEKDVSMQLDPEQDDDTFRIETVLVDNETLDVGPYKADHRNEVPVKGDVYTDPYIYTTIDGAKRSSVKRTEEVVSTGATTVSTMVTDTNTEMREIAGASTSGNQNEAFEASLIHL